MPGPVAQPGPAERVLAALTALGQDLAVAESLTGGALCAALVDVPGASAVLRGGVVAYATPAKHGLLGVPEDLLRRHGAVHPEVAAAMAAGVLERFGCVWGVSTTGVAGPEPQDGRPVGEVHVAVQGPRPGARSLLLPGGRAQVRAATVEAALELLLACVGEPSGAGPEGPGPPGR